jgi:hypothetical protein
MEALRSFGTPVLTRATRRNIPEDDIPKQISARSYTNSEGHFAANEWKVAEEKK